MEGLQGEEVVLPWLCGFPILLPPPSLEGRRGAAGETVWHTSLCSDEIKTGSLKNRIFFHFFNPFIFSGKNIGKIKMLIPS